MKRGVMETLVEGPLQEKRDAFGLLTLTLTSPHQNKG